YPDPAPISSMRAPGRSQGWTRVVSNARSLSSGPIDGITNDATRRLLPRPGRGTTFHQKPSSARKRNHLLGLICQKLVNCFGGTGAARETVVVAHDDALIIHSAIKKSNAVTCGFVEVHINVNKRKSSIFCVGEGVRYPPFMPADGSTFNKIGLYRIQTARKVALRPREAVGRRWSRKPFK